jgi:hypothetical protein
MSGEGAVFFFPHCIFYLFSFCYFIFILFLTAINLLIFVLEKKITIIFLQVF